jgi:hypothetical protein
VFKGTNTRSSVHVAKAPMTGLSCIVIVRIIIYVKLE